MQYLRASDLRQGMTEPIEAGDRATDGIQIIRKAHAIIVVDGRLSKNGELVLTSQHLLWTPIRFPFPRLEAQTLDLGDVRDCRVLGRTYMMMMFGIPLMVETSEHEYRFYFAGNPLHTLVRPRVQEEWRDAILAAVEERRRRLEGQ